MMRRPACLCTLSLLASLALATARLAADPPVETGEHRDTLLYVKTIPSGATILLDGKNIGTSDGTFRVEPGVGKVIVELDGYQPDSKEVTIRANGITRVDLTLNPRSSAADAQAGSLHWQLFDEVTLTSPKKRKAELFDLDMSKRLVMDEFGADDRQTHEWIRQHHMDVLGVVKGNIPALLLFDTVIKPIPQAEYDTIPVETVAGDWHLKQGEPDKITTLTTLSEGQKTQGCPTCIFRTRENGKGVLQLLGVGSEPKSVRIRYKLVQREPQAAEAGASETEQPAKQVLLPDADTKDAEVVLDLATGQTLKAPSGDGNIIRKGQEKSAFAELGKGDLFYDRVLACLRDSTAKKWDGVQAADLPALEKRGDATAYQLPTVPCRLLVTTAENRRFDVTILEVTDKGGIKLEYKELKP